MIRQTLPAVLLLSSIALLGTACAASTAGDMGTAVRETLAKADNLIMEN